VEQVARACEGDFSAFGVGGINVFHRQNPLRKVSGLARGIRQQREVQQNAPRVLISGTFSRV